jgi:hypothetical protein
MDACPTNYHNITGQTEADYLCAPNECPSRVPFANGSCSVGEDFGLGDVVYKCYNYKNKCSDGCPIGGTEVCKGRVFCFGNYIFCIDVFKIFSFSFFFFFNLFEDTPDWY